MTPFAYRRPRSMSEMVAALGAGTGALPLAGGTCLVDLMKQGVEHPTTVVDLNFVPELRGFDVQPNGTLRIGAATPLAHVARSRVVEDGWPLLHEAIVDGLTPQLRNAATFGGNVMQRPRCFFFREPGFACNKRAAGAGCAARAGVHYGHAIFGGDEAETCIAVHPSDLCVALTALDAVVTIAGSAGTRRLAIAGLHRLPGADATRETTLEAGEIVTAIEVSPERGRGAFVKGSEGFSLASCAALLALEGDVIVAARVVLGGVAHAPWRANRAEDALVGAAADVATFARAADAAVEGACTDAQTAFRIPLLRAVVGEALARAHGRSATEEGGGGA